MFRTSVLRGLIVIAVVASSSVAVADHARELFEQGRLEFAAGKFIEAAHLYEQAYQESARPALLWNIALAYRRQYDIDGDLANLRRARVVYQNFADLTTNPSEVAEARQSIAECDEILARGATPAPRPATTPPATPPPAPATTPPAAAQPATAPPAAGQPAPPSPSPQPALTATPAPAPSPAAERPHKSRWWIGVTVGAVAVVGLTVGLTVGLVPNNASPPSTRGGTMPASFQ